MPSAERKKIDDLNLRFIGVMERLGYTGYSLSRELGTSEAVISNIRTGKNPPNVLLVQALLNKHEEVDPGWLFSGKGAMFRRAGSSRERSTVTTRSEPVDGDLHGVEERLGRIESLLKRSITTQLERNMLTDESIAEVERRMDSMHRDLKPLRKGPQKKGTPRV